MCSISWQTNSSGYDLFFNRDEQRARPPAEPPRTFYATDGTPYLAPIDPQGGGTWIFLNAHGLSGALLNAYEVSALPAGETRASRGQLLRTAVHAADIDAFEAEIRETLQLDNYPACYLFAIARKSAPGGWLWTGQELEALSLPAPQFFTTSGFQPAAVRSAREQAFRHTLGDPPHRSAALEAFHLDAESKQTAYDIRMSRPDARTVSYTRVSVQDSTLKMHYLSCPEDVSDWLVEADGISISL